MSWGLMAPNAPSKIQEPAAIAVAAVSKSGLPAGSTATIDKNFSFYRLPDNTSGSAAIPIVLNPQPVAHLVVKKNAYSVVLIRASVGWRTTDAGNGKDRIAIAFAIWRDSPLTGTLVCSVQDSCAVGDSYRATSFEHIDLGFSEVTGAAEITYTLSAQQLTQTESAAEISGCLTFTALVME